MILPTGQQAEPMIRALHLGNLEASFGLTRSGNFTCLENSKPRDVQSQGFACLGETNQNTRMQIQEIRRAKLRQWFSARSVPTREKSYISQLLKDGNPFGERAARRLENTYGMGHMFLDTLESEDAGRQSVPDGQPPQAPPQASNVDPLLQAMRLLELFRSADERGRADMLRLAESLCGADRYHIGSNKG